MHVIAIIPQKITPPTPTPTPPRSFPLTSVVLGTRFKKTNQVRHLRIARPGRRPGAGGGLHGTLPRR